MQKFAKIYFILLLMLFTAAGNAQCAMCRAALESSDAGIKPEAVNDGIVCYAIYRQRKKMKQKAKEAASI
jgi:hypothetical protein